MERAGKRRLVVAAVVVVAAVGAFFFFTRDRASFSDAPEAGNVALSFSGLTADIHWESCRRAKEPKLLVWEESADGKLRWATFFRTGSGRSAYWLTRREDGITFEPGEGDRLGPVQDVRFILHAIFEDSERVEVEVPLSDLPNTDEGDVLLADGSTLERRAWLDDVDEEC